MNTASKATFLTHCFHSLLRNLEKNTILSQWTHQIIGNSASFVRSAPLFFSIIVLIIILIFRIHNFSFWVQEQFSKRFLLVIYKFQLEFIYNLYFCVIRDKHYSPSDNFRNYKGSMWRKEKKKREANSTWCSQAVTHPSTNHAQCCLTAVIRREPVCSTWYGRWRITIRTRSDTSWHIAVTKLRFSVHIHTCRLHLYCINFRA